MPYSFRSDQWLPYPAETVFAFLADPENLPALMPQWQRARLESVTLVPPPRANDRTNPPVAAGVGSRVTLSLRPLRWPPFRVRWHAEIIQFEANHFFCDRQVSGPFAYWQHVHRVRALDRNSPGVTVLTDEIEYDLPLGVLGHMAHALFVHKEIEAAFAYRREQILNALARAGTSQPAASPQESKAS